MIYGGEDDGEGMRRRTGRQVLVTLWKADALSGGLNFLLALIVWGYAWYEGYEQRLPLGRHYPKGA